MLWTISTKEHGDLLYDSEAITLGETFELNRLAGLNLEQLQNGFLEQNAAAWRFVWWVTLTRAGINPGPYADIDFNWRDLVITPVVEAEAEDDGGDPDRPTGTDQADEATTGGQTPSESQEPMSLSSGTSTD